MSLSSASPVPLLTGVECLAAAELSEDETNFLAHKVLVSSLRTVAPASPYKWEAQDRLWKCPIRRTSWMTRGCQRARRCPSKRACWPPARNAITTPTATRRSRRHSPPRTPPSRPGRIPQTRPPSLVDSCRLHGPDAALVLTSVRRPRRPPLPRPPKSRGLSCHT